MDISFVQLELSRLRGSLTLAAASLELISQDLQGQESKETVACLGPAPRRQCPWCKKSIMGAATRCGYCWKTVAPARSSG